MKRLNKIVSAIVLSCFLLNTAIIEPAIAVAPPSKYSPILGIQKQDLARIEAILRMHLARADRKDGKIDMKALVKSAGEYRDSVFKTQIFFTRLVWHPRGFYSVMCSTSDAKNGQREYHAVFSPGEKAGDFLVRALTEEEWASFAMAVSTDRPLPRENRDSEINKAIARYIYEGEEIDDWIRQRIKKGSFVEIEGMADSLGWNKLYSVRVRPKDENILPKTVFDAVKTKFNGFLEPYRKDMDEVFRGKNIVFVGAEDGMGLPEITCPDPDTEGSGFVKVIVTEHTSENAVYILLNAEEFKRLCQIIKDKSSGREIMDVTMATYITRKLVHSAGVIYGMPYKLEGRYHKPDESGDPSPESYMGITNALGRAYSDSSSLSDADRKELERFVSPETKPVNLDIKIEDRDYASGANPDAAQKRIVANIMDLEIGKGLARSLPAYTGSRRSDAESEQPVGSAGRSRLCASASKDASVVPGRAVRGSIFEKTLVTGAARSRILARILEELEFREEDDLITLRNELSRYPAKFMILDMGENSDYRKGYLLLDKDTYKGRLFGLENLNDDLHIFPAGAYFGALKDAAPNIRETVEKHITGQWRRGSDFMVNTVDIKAAGSRFAVWYGHRESEDPESMDEHDTDTVILYDAFTLRPVSGFRFEKKAYNNSVWEIHLNDDFFYIVYTRYASDINCISVFSSADGTPLSLERGWSKEHSDILDGGDTEAVFRTAHRQDDNLSQCGWVDNYLILSVDRYDNTALNRMTRGVTVIDMRNMKVALDFVPADSFYIYDNTLAAVTENGVILYHLSDTVKIIFQDHSLSREVVDTRENNDFGHMPYVVLDTHFDSKSRERRLKVVDMRYGTVIKEVNCRGEWVFNGRYLVAVKDNKGHLLCYDTKTRTESVRLNELQPNADERRNGIFTDKDFTIVEGGYLIARRAANLLTVWNLETDSPVDGLDDMEIGPEDAVECGHGYLMVYHNVSSEEKRDAENMPVTLFRGNITVWSLNTGKIAKDVGGEKISAREAYMFSTHSGGFNLNEDGSVEFVWYGEYNGYKISYSQVVIEPAAIASMDDASSAHPVNNVGEKRVILTEFRNQTGQDELSKEDMDRLAAGSKIYEVPCAKDETCRYLVLDDTRSGGYMSRLMTGEWIFHGYLSGGIMAEPAQAKPEGEQIGVQEPNLACGGAPGVKAAPAGSMPDEVMTVIAYTDALREYGFTVNTYMALYPAFLAGHPEYGFEDEVTPAQAMSALGELCGMGMLESSTAVNTVTYNLTMEGKREIDKILAAESPAGGLGRHYRNVHNMNAAPLFDYFSEYGGRRIMIALPSRPDGVYRFSNGVFAYLMTQEGSSVRIDMPPVCRRVVERLGEVVGDNDFVVEATRNGYREIRTTNGELEILINANMPFEIGLRVNNAARERFNSLPIAAYTEDTKAMLPLAREVGGKIPTYADDRYTLLLPEEFFPGDSLKSEIASYQDKFNIAKIATTDKGSPVSEESIVADILGKSAGIEKRTAALVPDTISSAGVRKLKDAGIRVLRIDVGGLVTDLRERYGENASYVAQFRNDTYATMLLARQIKADTPRDSSLYRLLEFYVRSHFLFTEPMAASDYIRAIVGSDMTSVAWLLKGILSYRPVWPYDAFREYRYIAEALISA